MWTEAKRPRRGAENLKTAMAKNREALKDHA